MKHKLALLCSSISRGGLELYTARLASSLKEQGHDIIVIAQKESFLEEILKEKKIKTYTIEKKSQYLCFPTAKNVAKILKDAGFNKLMIMTPKDVDLGAFTKAFFLKSTKLIYLQQMLIGIQKKTWYFDWKFGKLDRWYAPLNWLKDEVGTNTNLDMNKVRVVPVTIECDEFVSHQTTREQARDLFSMEKDTFYFGFIGRIDVLKGPHIVLKAFEKLRREYFPNENIKLVVVGDRTSDQGREKVFADNFEESLKRSPCKDSIERYSFIKNIKDMFRAINIFLMSSQYETVGLVTQEAMATGTLVIGADTGGTPELINFGECGYVFKTNDVDDLCEKMKEAYEQKDQHQDMMNKARKYVVENFDRSIACQKIEEDLDTL